MTFMLHSKKKTAQLTACGTSPLRSPHGKLSNNTLAHHRGLRDADDRPCRLFTAAVLALDTLSRQLVHTEWIVYVMWISPDWVPLRGQRRRQLGIEALRSQGAV